MSQNDLIVNEPEGVGTVGQYGRVRGEIVDSTSNGQTPLLRAQEVLEFLRQERKALLDELFILRRRNDRLAAALGACELCWGEDVRCPICRGQAVPGTMLPDHLLLAEYVMPALSKLRLGQENNLGR